eukprot:TRINITY_DN3968_c0_g1_i1.p1 TRINITY_DN3968_c0_g1~~TRINITY_DN3968_c0_g1_i1.p1  ORF type:complete len:178 (-),score=60.22 TRINITY_DN3968_c0_g1_i1:11-544(-)
MLGDIAMLKNCARCWYYRFVGACVPPQVEVQVEEKVQVEKSEMSPWMSYVMQVYAKSPPMAVTLQSIGPLQEEDVPLSAIDHHCSSILDHILGLSHLQDAIRGYLKETFGNDGDAADKIKACIWIFRSSINHKRLMYGDADEIRKIREDSCLLKPLYEIIKDALDEFSLTYVSRRLR